MAACVVLVAVGVAVWLQQTGRLPLSRTAPDRGVTAVAPSTGTSTSVERGDSVGKGTMNAIHSPRRRLTATVIPVTHIRKTTPTQA